jgi:hypothetical protein
VHAVRGEVRGPASIDHDDRAASAPEHERRAEPGRPAADDRHVDGSYGGGGDGRGFVHGIII